MAQIASVDPSAGQAATAATATSAADAAGKLGLPPASLAAAAATNTVNAELATSQWGVDPNAVGGVYGGAAQSSGLFGNGDLLPLLQSLSPATAEQALTLIGIGPAKSRAATNTAAAARAAAASNAKTLFGQSSSSDGSIVVDPLWGKSA